MPRLGGVELDAGLGQHAGLGDVLANLDAVVFHHRGQVEQAQRALHRRQVLGAMQFQVQRVAEPVDVQPRPVEGRRRARLFDPGQRGALVEFPLAGDVAVAPVGASDEEVLPIVVVRGVEVELAIVVGVDDAHVVDLRDGVDGQRVGLEVPPLGGDQALHRRQEVVACGVRHDQDRQQRHDPAQRTLQQGRKFHRVSASLWPIQACGQQGAPAHGFAAQCRNR